MNKNQADWIVNRLCPFILREQGRGFAMSTWVDRDTPVGDPVIFDGVRRKVPSCGTICCIGGSICFLKKINAADDREIFSSIGLSHKQGDDLCYGWKDDWPEPFRSRFAKATTAVSKARVAVSLLKHIAKTRGKCLKS